MNLFLIFDIIVSCRLIHSNDFKNKKVIYMENLEEGSNELISSLKSLKFINLFLILNLIVPRKSCLSIDSRY